MVRNRNAKFATELSPGPSRNDYPGMEGTKPTSGLVTFDPPKAALKVVDTGIFHVAPSSSKHIHFDDEETEKSALTPIHREPEIKRNYTHTRHDSRDYRDSRESSL